MSIRSGRLIATPATLPPTQALSLSPRPRVVVAEKIIKLGKKKKKYKRINKVREAYCYACYAPSYASSLSLRPRVIVAEKIIKLED